MWPVMTATRETKNDDTSDTIARVLVFGAGGNGMYGGWP